MLEQASVFYKVVPMPDVDLEATVYRTRPY